MSLPRPIPLSWTIGHLYTATVDHHNAKATGMPLSQAQIKAIDITEKTGSVFSVIGEAFVITTFLFSSKFRKPVNRLVFYATWGNIFANVATLIGRNAISMGFEEPLCQFQGFLIQWFMPADALWTFAMALNVWLSFFHHYDAVKIRSLEWKYFLLCYGLPLPSAFVLLFIANDYMGRVYGDAMLWCWISIQWDFLRVAVFYAPVWVVIILTMTIYIRVGVVICRWRKQLKSLGRYSDQERQQGQESCITPIPTHGIRRTDEVTIVRGVADYSSGNTNPQGFLSPTPHETDAPKRLSVHSWKRLLKTRKRSISRGSRGTFQEASNHANKASVKYLKCALLFFIVLLITWVPSTINRIYTLIYPNEIVFGLQFAASLVLPLQGFWNAVIYIATSMYACKCLWHDALIVCRLRKPVVETVPVCSEVRNLSFDSRGRWREDSDTSSLKQMYTH